MPPSVRLLHPSCLTGYRGLEHKWLAGAGAFLLCDAAARRGGREEGTGEEEEGTTEGTALVGKQLLLGPPSRGDSSRQGELLTLTVPPCERRYFFFLAAGLPPRPRNMAH